MSLEGWAPVIGADLSLAEAVELAFDYRGNTTVVTRAGTSILGYVFNRDGSAPAPFIQLFDEHGDGPITIPYAEIAAIRFTGRDMAAGNSWKAWLERRDRDRAGEGGAPAAGPGDRSPDPRRG